MKGALSAVPRGRERSLSVISPNLKGLVRLHRLRYMRGDLRALLFD
jgi:hypothetical protein